ncbi:hypothetical protein [Legionella gresilensis]|nr:hypothetical protein [Legionella gresilensis]
MKAKDIFSLSTTLKELTIKFSLGLEEVLQKLPNKALSNYLALKLNRFKK